MTDYKGLCTALREEAEAVQAVEWEIPLCTQNHILEAAEAIEKLVRERDTALKKTITCSNCKHYKKFIGEMPCRVCFDHDKWEWMGVEDDS